MKVDLDAVLMDFDGEPIVEQALKKGTQQVETDASGEPVLVPVPLKKVLKNALLYKAPGENLSLKEQLERAALVKRINRGGEQSLRAEDISLCKELVSRAFTITVLSAVVDLIDPMGE